MEDIRVFRIMMFTVALGVLSLILGLRVYHLSANTFPNTVVFSENENPQYGYTQIELGIFPVETYFEAKLPIGTLVDMEDGNSTYLEVVTMDVYLDSAIPCTYEVGEITSVIGQDLVTLEIACTIDFHVPADSLTEEQKNQLLSQGFMAEESGALVKSGAYTFTHNMG